MDKITISRIGSLTLYYFVASDGKTYYNYRDKHSPMMLGTENLATAVCGFHTDACKERFHTNKQFKSWKDLFKRRDEISRSVSHQIYKDLQTKLGIT